MGRRRAHASGSGCNPDRGSERDGEGIRSHGRGARHLTLEVRATNTDAQLLYERFGFSPVGKRKGYYQGEDAIVMWALDVDAEEYGTRLDEIRSEIKAASA